MGTLSNSELEIDERTATFRMRQGTLQIPAEHALCITQSCNIHSRAGKIGIAIDVPMRCGYPSSSDRRPVELKLQDSQNVPSLTA